MSRETIAFVLKQKRKACGYSVDSVIETLDRKYQIQISVKTLYSYESGHRQPDADTLMSLCDIYNIQDIMEAFGYSQKKEPPSISTKTENDKNLQKLLLNYNNMNLKGQFALADYSDYLSTKEEYCKHSNIPVEKQA